MSDREQLERARYRAERARERERERRRRGGLSQPELSQQQPGQEPRRRPTARRTATAPAPAPARESSRRDRTQEREDGQERERGYTLGLEREPSRRERDRGSGEQEGERDGRRERERQRSTRDPTGRDPHRQSRSNPPTAPATTTIGAGITDRRESTRDLEPRRSRRDRGDLREETVRLVPRDAEGAGASEGLVRGGTRRRSHSARDREPGVDRVGSNRNPQRERSRRERATVPADSYDRRQAEMRARYQPVPQVLAPEPAIAHGPILAGWNTGGDGSADTEKGNGVGSAGLLSDKRASTGSGVGLLQNGKTERGLWRRPCFWVLAIVGVLLLIIVVPVGVLVTKKHKSGNGSSSSDAEAKGEKQGLQDINPSSVPAEAKGTYYDPFDWLDTTDFNCTYTDETVGGLPIMGLFSEWDDSARANDKVPPLNEPFDYGKQPIRGVNVGGWFVLEPFITPSFFNHWDSSLGIVDEYTLSKHLGPDDTRKTLESHYSTFITEDDFRMIRDAGLDHVRIPYGYWAAMKLDGDPYLYQVQWRYLLRAIEWCRKYGLRVNLDLHSVPGGANGWNHSGRLGPINWLRGPDGQKNGQLTLDLHKQLSKFFAQPRYKNLVTFYGLVNEPRMTTLDPATVTTWSAQAYKIIRDNGYNGKIAFGDGFRGLFKWIGAFAGLDGMVLDVHQYVIFNTAQLSLSHTAKVQFACKAWAQQLSQSMDPTIGYGPTVVGEWGQADTDCTPFLNNVGVGTRWEGTLYYGENNPGNVLTPYCPIQDQCSCKEANEDPLKYSDAYKLFLKTFAIAQMDAFENGWGWMYWTWQTENAPQWSYRKGLDAGILPSNATDRGWSCNSAVPDFASQGLLESY